MNALAPKRVFFVVGEESGDRLGASLAAELRARHGQHVQFEGLGAEGLAQHGLASIFDIEDIAVMGFAPVIARLPTILQRIGQTQRAILGSKPDLVVLIDSPDFTHRVARAVRRHAQSIPIIGWVSPSVWAWRPGRAKAMRAFIDHLLVLLPFEVEAHQRLGGPPASYVGHPLVSELTTLRPQTSHERLALGPNVPANILLLPGSRSGEVARHMSLLKEAMEITLGLLQSAGQPAPHITIPAVAKHASTIASQVADWPFKVDVVSDELAKRAVMRRAHAALAASGTVTLELALSGIPTVVFYKLDTVAHLLRRLVKVWTIILPNLVLGRPLLREYVDEFARPEALARALFALAIDTPERRAQVEAFAELDSLMKGHDDRTPAQRASDVVDGFLFPGK